MATFLLVLERACLGASRESTVPKDTVGLILRTFLGLTIDVVFPDPGFLEVECLATVFMLPDDFLEADLKGIVYRILGLAESLPPLESPGGWIPCAGGVPAAQEVPCLEEPPLATWGTPFAGGGPAAPVAPCLEEPPLATWGIPFAGGGPAATPAPCLEELPGAGMSTAGTCEQDS